MNDRFCRKIGRWKCRRLIALDDECIAFFNAKIGTDSTSIYPLLIHTSHLHRHTERITYISGNMTMPHARFNRTERTDWSWRKKCFARIRESRKMSGKSRDGNAE